MMDSDTIVKEIYTLFRHPDYTNIFPHIRQDYVRRMYSHNQVFVTEVNNVIAGVLIYHIYKVNNPHQLGMKGDVQLCQIVVHPDYKGSGLAQSLFTQLIDLACRINAGQIVLSVRKSNERAIAFYRKMGMKKIGETTWKQGTIPGIVLSYPLDKHIEDIQMAIEYGLILNDVEEEI